jgi:5-hydroxyisourate hydrolase
MSPITTHVLDTATGKPAAGVPIQLDVRASGTGIESTFRELGRGVTDSDGRLKSLMAPGTLSPGVYRITFDTSVYYAGKETFYPYVSFVFEIKDTTAHYHVPLLLSPFGISTYRGS